MDLYKICIQKIYDRILRDYHDRVAAIREECSDGMVDFAVDEELYPALKQMFEENGFMVWKCDTAHEDDWMRGMRLESQKDYSIRMDRKRMWNENNKRYRPTSP